MGNDNIEGLSSILKDIISSLKKPTKKKWLKPIWITCTLLLFISFVTLWISILCGWIFLSFGQIVILDLTCLLIGTCIAVIMFKGYHWFFDVGEDDLQNKHVNEH